MKHLIFCSFILISVVTFSQNREIYYESDRTSKDQQKYPEALLFSKVNQQVYFKHEGIEVWCDQAVFYQEDNFFRAFGQVKMN
ncbi:MAG: OstA-like protein, partial [Psychroflexus salarius]